MVESKKIKSFFKTFFLENIEVILIALLIVIPVRYFLMEPFIVSGTSMEPTFSPKDYLIVDKISYFLRDPKRYEIIVLRSPVRNNTSYLKRIIGLPGENIIIQDGQVFVYNLQTDEKKILSEDFLPSNLNTFGDIDITLQQNQFFVLGDNRNVSSDSRNWGPISQENVIGKVLLRLWPLEEATFFN